MPNPREKLRVFLSAEQREALETLCRRQSVGAAKVRRARILLMSDESQPEGSRPDHEIADVVGLCERQVVRIRQKFVREGEQISMIDRRPRPAGPRMLDGKGEATLVTICCSDPPAGRDRWTLQLLCNELARLKIVRSICPETVRQVLKKTNLSLGYPRDSVSRIRTARVSSRGWKKSSMSTTKSTTSGTR